MGWAVGLAAGLGREEQILVGIEHVGIEQGGMGGAAGGLELIGRCERCGLSHMAEHVLWRQLAMSTQTQPRKPQFKRKNAFFTALAVVGLPLSLVLLFVGGVGMMALADTEGKTALAQGVVGATARAIVKWNYLTIAMVFNGGLLGGCCMVKQGECRSCACRRQQRCRL